MTSAWMTSALASHRWPARNDEGAWADLANRALQLESQAIDEADNQRWAATVAALVEGELPYSEYTAARMAALDERLRQRKLDQTNLRYKYGFKPRRASLVHRAVQEFFSR